jgi:hypothetical protein
MLFVDLKDFGRFDPAGGKLCDNLPIGAEEVVLAKFAWQDPGNLFERDGLEGFVGDRGGEEADFQRLIAIRVLMLDSPEFDRFS